MSLHMSQGVEGQTDYTDRDTITFGNSLDATYRMLFNRIYRCSDLDYAAFCMATHMSLALPVVELVFKVRLELRELVPKHLATPPTFQILVQIA